MQGKITFCTLYTHHIQMYGNIAAYNHMTYACTHLMQSAHMGISLCKERHPSWSKILLIKQLFENMADGEYAFWIDADAMIMKTDKLFELRDVDFGFTADENGLNFGVFYLRNTEVTRAFLDAVWASTEFITHKYWEQGAVHHLWPEWSQKITSYKHGPELQSYSNKFKPESFICHWAARSNLDRCREMFRTFKRIHGYAPVFNEDRLRENKWSIDNA